jgi:biopolymer transport protein ExbB/TolQ
MPARSTHDIDGPMTNLFLQSLAQAPHQTGWLTGHLLEFARGGAEWVLWVLAVLSFFSVGVMVERWLFYRRHGVDAQGLRLMLVQHLDDGQPERAVERLRGAGQSMEARVLVYGLQNFERGVSAVSELMSGALSRERVRYDRNLGFLATLGNNAPFIGLFGTVLGIIQAFDGLAGLDMSDPNAASSAVMGPIAEALIATGVGLLVAIPAVIAFNLFKGRVRKVVSNTELLARTILASLPGPAGAPVSVTGAGAGAGPGGSERARGEG